MFIENGNVIDKQVVFVNEWAKFIFIQQLELSFQTQCFLFSIFTVKIIDE